MPTVAFRYESNKLFANRLFLSKITLALAFLGGFLLSTKLWVASRSYRAPRPDLRLQRPFRRL